ncbi:MAG TPA: SpoIIE family protein phosphatase [Acidimicrobiales bacterium]|nr:SpoIIE family protein phosphatase [Acidimicrobiales bacterium]
MSQRPVADGVAMRLPARSASVATARHAVRDLAEQWSLPEGVVLDAEMVVSELVTNAVLHARTDCELSIEPRLPGLRLAVADDDDAAPLPPTAFVPLADGLLTGADSDKALAGLLAERATGRGMAIVEALSSRWGVESRNGGKVVWAELGTNGHAAGSPTAPPVAAAGRRLGVRNLRVVAVPVRLLVQSDNAVSALLREFQLAIVDHPTGRRMVETLITPDVLARIESTTRPREQAVRAALARGDHLIDLELELPVGAPGTLAEIDELLARMVMTGPGGLPPRPAEVVAFDAWYRDEVAAQMAGVPPRACPFPSAPLARAHAVDAELSPHWRRALRSLEDAVSTVTDEPSVEEALVRFAVEALPASNACICALAADGVTVRITAAHGFPEDVAQAWDEFPLSAELPASEAIRTNRPVVIRTRGEREERYEALSERPGLEDPTNVCVPIAPPFGVAMGCLVVAFTPARDFSADELSSLSALASVAGSRIQAIRDERGAERHRKRQVVLDRLVKDLARAGNEENMALAVCDALVPDVTDLATVDLSMGGTGRTVVAAHRDPEKQPLIARLQGEWVSPRVEDVLRSGQPYVFHIPSREVFSRVVGDDEHAGLLRDLDIAAGAVVPVTIAGTAVGALSVCATGRRAFTPEDVAFVTEVTRWLGSALAKRREDAATPAPLAGDARPSTDAVIGLAAALSAAVTVDEVSGAVFRHIVAGLGAATSSVWVRGPDGVMRITSGVGISPDVNSFVGAIAPDSSLPAAEAVRTGRPVWYASREERDRRFPELAGAPSLSESNVVLPLRARGTTRGVLSIGFTEVREFGPGELAALQQVADLCATALDRGELFDAERDARQLVQFLADAGGLLAGSLEADRIVDLVADLAVPRLGEWCTVFLPDGRWLRRTTVNVAGEPELGERLLGTALRIDGTTPVARCFTTGEVVVSTEMTTEALAAAHPGDALPDVLALGLREAVTAPVRSRGRVLGVFSVASRRPRAHSELYVQAVSELAARVGAALEIAQRFSEEQAASKALAAALLPAALPQLPGVELAARYLPAAGDVCGDWYEVDRLPDGRLLIGIGDAAGHGVPAAALMAELRYGARALAAIARSPGELLHDLAIAMAPGERYATATYLVIDPASLAARWASAGHLPALLVPAKGKPRFLDRPSGPPLGSPPGVWPEHELALEPGDTIVLYTDGLVERRGVGLEEGMRKLALAAGRNRRGSADELADVLIDLGRPEHDDACLVVLRVAPGD